MELALFLQFRNHLSTVLSCQVTLDIVATTSRVTHQETCHDIVVKGEALPSWLIFEPKEMTFSGRAREAGSW